MDLVNTMTTALLPFKNLVALTFMLLGPALAAFVLVKLGTRRLGDVKFGARVGVALFLLMTSSAHFLDTSGMAQMLPGLVPLRELVVVATGLLEVALALAVLHSKSARLAGLAIIAMLIGFLPANIYAALNYIPFGGAEMGPAYLLVRVPYQGFVIAFVFWATQRPPIESARDRPTA